MSFKSSTGRDLGKLLEVFKSNKTTLGQGVGGGSQAVRYVAVDSWVVAGGGGGGADPSTNQSCGGGGGAGGFRLGTVSLEASKSYSIVVGSGGGAISNGSPSSIVGVDTSMIAAGGGAAGPGAGGGAGSPGGSGGGGGMAGYQPTGTTFAAGQGNVPDVPTILGGPQGYPGAASLKLPGINAYGGGGGGGGAAGGPTREGGIGVKIPWNIPPSYGTPGPTPGRWFVGGGSGTYDSNNAPGGAGGGGSGGGSSVTAGTINTGGGGGAGFTGVGQPGGSGIVILRTNSTYGTATVPPAAVTSTPGDGYTYYYFTASGTIQFS